MEDVTKRVHSIKELTPYLVVAVVIFTVCLSFGLIVPPSNSGKVIADLQKTLEPLMSLGPLELLVFIFLNNVFKTLMAIVLGIALGLPSLLFISLNGYALGLLVSATRPTTSSWVIIAGLAPHGIIEIAVLLISTTMGIMIGFESFKWIVKRESAVRSWLRWCLVIYLKWILAALLIAALIEVFITPELIFLAGGGEIPLE